MPSVSISIDGVEKTKNRLARAVDVRTLRPPMMRAVLRIERDMKKYPPQRAGSSYIRGYGYPGNPTSERLGQSWTHSVKMTGGGLEGRVGNNTSYGPFVQSHEFQASIHRGRWQTDLEVLDRNRADIVRDFEKSIDGIVK